MKKTVAKGIETRFINPNDYLQEIKKLWRKYYSAKPYELSYPAKNIADTIKQKTLIHDYKWIGVFSGSKLVCVYSYSGYHDIFTNLNEIIWFRNIVGWERTAMIRASVNDPDFRMRGATGAAIEFMELNAFKDNDIIVAPVFCVEGARDYYSKHGYEFLCHYPASYNPIDAKDRQGNAPNIAIDIMVKAKTQP